MFWRYFPQNVLSYFSVRTIATWMLPFDTVGGGGGEQNQSPNNNYFGFGMGVHTLYNDRNWLVNL